MGCVVEDSTQQSKSPQIANPASNYCIQHQGKLDMRENSAGQYGVCIFSDGSECEEWKFFRGECQPGG